MKSDIQQGTCLFEPECKDAVLQPPRGVDVFQRSHIDKKGRARRLLRRGGALVKAARLHSLE